MAWDIPVMSFITGTITRRIKAGALLVAFVSGVLPGDTALTVTPSGSRPAS